MEEASPFLSLCARAFEISPFTLKNPAPIPILISYDLHCLPRATLKAFVAIKSSIKPLLFINNPSPTPIILH